MPFGLRPEQFDIAGLAVFVFITIVALYGLKHEILPRWVYWLLLLVGLGGGIVDGLIVLTYF